MKRTILAAAACFAFSGAIQAAVPADTTDSSYRRGSVDRDNWEAWFAGLYGDNLAGASYWAENRNKNPLPCFQTGQNYVWMAGCNEASRRLSPIDFQRKTDSQYWNGWNKKTAFVPGIPGEAVSQPYPTPTYTPPPPITPAAKQINDTRACAFRASQEIGGRFDAYYDDFSGGWKTFGGNGGFFYFSKCMNERGYSMALPTG